MTRVIVARHAEPDRVSGLDRTKWPLTRFGRAQAEHLAGRLADLAPLNVVSGPAVRTKETAELAAKRLRRPVKVDPRFGDILAPKGEDTDAWLASIFNSDAPVHWRDLDAAVNRWRNDTVQAVRELTEDAVVFTQYTNINAIAAAALRVEVTKVCRPDFASITEFSVVNGDVRMVIDGRDVVGPNA
ncbi:MAG: histidine phosphatase family protein [Proteobacteria bacterium]|nr:histidine phosphatase family protein [Pseudomonadota bacterium]